MEAVRDFTGNPLRPLGQVNVEALIKGPTDIGPKCSQYVAEQLIAIWVGTALSVGRVVEDEGGPNLRVSMFNGYREQWMGPTWIARAQVEGGVNQ